MYLMTERLLLRPVEYQDIDQLVAMWTDPAIACAAGGPQEREAVRERLDEEAESPAPGAYGRWPLIEKASGVVVGDCGLLETEVDGRTEVELSCMIGRHAKGRGYGGEIGAALLRFASEIMGVDRVIVLVDPACEPSRAFVAELGMQLESTTVGADGVEREVWALRAEAPQDRP